MSQGLLKSAFKFTAVAFTAQCDSQALNMSCELDAIMFVHM